VELKSIPFNKPYLSGNELAYILEAVQSGKISGNGLFTKKCHRFFEQQYQFKKCLLTTSCTDALEMAAILINIKSGDEVIVPSYTFVSTANAFVLRGAKIVFCDSGKNNPNLDVELIEGLITKNTIAIVAVHYAGTACDMDAILQIAKKYGLFVIEDAAQAIDSFYKGRRLGSIGHLAAFSFHETKNIQCGEGGMLVINDDQFIKRAEIIWEKGTNRSAFFSGETDKYNWVDIGSSFLPSDLNAAFLFAQLENLKLIQKKRLHIWERYFLKLSELATKGLIRIPNIPEYATKNGHLFYIICRNTEVRAGLISFLKKRGILSVFHYLSLHNSVFYISKYEGRTLINADNYSNNLLRLPLYYELSDVDIDFIITSTKEFFDRRI